MTVQSVSQLEVTMTETTTASLEPIRFEARNAMLIAGLRAHYSPQTMSKIPALWQRLVPYLGRISDRVGPENFGVYYRHDDAGGFDYLCGFEVNDLSGTASTGMARVARSPASVGCALA
jgi:AraC family transcriptional regulator